MDTQKKVSRPEALNTTAAKAAMLEALEKLLGIVSTAAQVAGVARSAHYNWMQSDMQYKAAVQSIADKALDFAETHLHALIKDKNPAAVIFFLKTKGKARGYVERQEIEVQESRPLSWFQE